jgi:hypothetical protein
MLALAASARAAPTTLPCQFRDGLIFVSVAIGAGPPGLFLLDTGAATTVLDARFAQAAGVRLGEPIQLRGGGGATEARQAEDVALTLTGEPPLLTDPVVADLGGPSRGMGLRLDGILGDDILRRFVVTLDYRGQTVRLADAGKAPPADAVTMRLLATPFVGATIENAGRRAAAAFQIDTGANTALALWAPFAAQALALERGRPAYGVGVGGPTRGEVGRVESLDVAGRRIIAPKADYADQVRPDDAGGDYGGVIGGPAWAGLVLILDFPHRRVWVR